MTDKYSTETITKRRSAGQDKRRQSKESQWLSAISQHDTVPTLPTSTKERREPLHKRRLSRHDPVSASIVLVPQKDDEDRLEQSTPRAAEDFEENVPVIVSSQSRQDMPPNSATPPATIVEALGNTDAPAVAANAPKESATREGPAGEDAAPVIESLDGLEKHLLESQSSRGHADHSSLSDFQAFGAEFYRTHRIDSTAAPFQNHPMREAPAQPRASHDPPPRPVAPDPPDLRRRTLIGYEKLANMLTTAPGSIRPAYRKFEMLHHRILLHVQDELCELEEQLRRLDEAVAQNRESGLYHLPSRRAEAYYGSEVHARRTHLLGQIFVKLEQYRE